MGTRTRNVPMEVLRDFLKSPSVVCGHLLEQFIQHGLDVETLVTEIVLKEEFNALVVQPLHLSTSESSRIWHKLEHLRNNNDTTRTTLGIATEFNVTVEKVEETNKINQVQGAAEVVPVGNKEEKEVDNVLETY